MKKLFVLEEKCNGCMACAVACQEAHAGSEHYAPIRDVMPARIFIQSVDDKAMPLVCQHCEEPRCVTACMSGAMQKDEKTGIVTNEGHRQKCVGCWMCIMSCPYGVINQMDDDGGRVAVKCDMCVTIGAPACVGACPNGAVIYEDEQYVEEALKGGYRQ